MDCCGGEKDESANTFQKGGENDLSNGPAQNRACTDIVCIPIFILAQVMFIVVTVIGMADGNQEKLYRPRDYQGGYCSVAKNWNNGTNLADQTKLSYTMNVSSFVDSVMKQTICSSQASEVMMDILPTQAAKDEYRCDCCRTPCKKCDGAYDFGGDLASAAAITEVVTARMAELTDPDKAKELFSPASANGQTFSTEKFWSEVTKYFNMVCLPSCQPNIKTLTPRPYTFSPSRDSVFYKHWNTIVDSVANNSDVQSLQDVIQSAFTFGALPVSVCPYHPSLCVPVPGIVVKEAVAGSDFCTFAIAADVVGALGDVAANAFESLGFEAFSGAASESFGQWFGDFQTTLDTFIITAVLSFVLGVLFLVLLRFFISACVWISVVATVVMFFFFGFFLFVKSGQCEGAGILDTGKQVSVAIVVAGSTAVKDAATGESVSEAMTGDGVDYKGRQQYTRLGKKCLTWETQNRAPQYRASNYTVLRPVNSTQNYCRNPYLASDPNKAKTIWCITSDPDVAWEECLPIGVIQPECAHGYAITGQSARDALWYSSFVIWALGIVWIIVIICMVGRIKLAIALNKVAAQYLSTNPSTVLIPVVQALIAIIWCIAWFYSISFLLSQVPDSYTPKQAYATYSEAFGTQSNCSIYEFGDHCTASPGKCTDKWPTGSVWKDPECDVGPNGEALCWRCAPPRFALDVRFALSLFVFLWNNAFNIATGQMLIAMAVSLWFFTTEKASAFVVVRSLKTVFRYHLGTIAFGSFIVAVVEWIRYVMKYFEKQAEAQKNRVMVVLLKILQCCMWCFEKCIKFLNKNAYIQTALMGTGFCTSAKKAFFLILRNALRFATVAVLGNGIRLIGFLCIMSGTGCIGYLLLDAMHPDVSPFFPLVLMLACGYVVANLFMNVFGLAVDTALQCFLAVEEMGEGGDFVPSSLSDFVKDVK